jgi:hypothetical protein
MKLIGTQLNPILEEIERAILEFDVRYASPHGFSDAGFRASIFIFISAFTDKIHELQERENMSVEDRVEMVKEAGKEINRLIKVYTNFETRHIVK